MSISTGLKAAYLMQEGVDPNIAYDDSIQGHNVALTNTTWEVGGGLNCNANGEFGLLDNTGDTVVDSEIGTIILCFNSHTSFGNGKQNLLLGIVRETEGDMYLLKNTNTLYFLLRDTVTTHFITLVSAQVPNYQSGFNIAIQWNRNAVIHDSKNMAFNIDGSYVVPNASARADSWNSFDTVNAFGILNDTGNPVFYADGILDYAYFFKRILSEAELTEIKANHNIILADYFRSNTGRTINKGKGKGL